MTRRSSLIFPSRSRWLARFTKSSFSIGSPAMFAAFRSKARRRILKILGPYEPPTLNSWSSISSTSSSDSSSSSVSWQLSAGVFLKISPSKAYNDRGLVSLVSNSHVDPSVLGSRVSPLKEEHTYIGRVSSQLRWAYGRRSGAPFWRFHVWTQPINGRWCREGCSVEDLLLRLKLGK